MKVKIAKICLEIDGKKIELTLKQAQQLKDVLNDTFGETVTEYIYPYHAYPYSTTTFTTTTQPTVTRPQIWCNAGDTYAMSAANISGELNSSGTMTLALNG